MQAPQIHLMLNHVPVLGTLFAVVTLGAGVWMKNAGIVKLALAALVIVALAAMPVFFTGEPAEKAIEHAAGVSERVVEPHEDFAKVSLVAVILLGAASAFALLRFRGRELSRGMALTVLVAGLGVAGMLAWTAHLGGMIRHPELRAGSVMNGGGEASAETDDD